MKIPIIIFAILCSVTLHLLEKHASKTILEKY